MLAANRTFHRQDRRWKDAASASLRERERVLSTITTRGNRARWTGERGDAAGAREQFAELLHVEERVRSAVHPGTLATRSALAHWTGAAGDAAGARDQFAALLNDQTRVLGPEHPDTLATRSALAYWRGRAGAIATNR